ncbi:MAG: hypothetical protein DMF60_05360 [Acidobacteria bacterium]|nr:MAG: hypothetical protein DMF60_05360 [Acidobacteriota bacterium]
MIGSSTNQRHTTAGGLPHPVSDLPPRLPTSESSATKRVIVVPIIIIMLVGAGFGWMAGAGLYNTVYRPIPAPNDPPASMIDQPDTDSQPPAKPEPAREVGGREARSAEPARFPAALTRFRVVGRILGRMVGIGRGKGYHGEHARDHHGHGRHGGH